VIVPLVVLSLILPVFTQTVPGPFLSFPQEMFLVIVSVGLYCAFLAMQMSRHRDYFTLGDRIVGQPLRENVSTAALFARAALLIAYLVPVVFLARQLAHPVDYLIETLDVPAALGGVIMAVLVATPEAIGAVRAAMANQLQRSINIFLGSVLSTIGLTIPAMVLISHLIGEDFLLGLEHTDIVMLSLTLLVSVITFASGHTNVMQGAVHLILFATYLLLIVNP
jgi:Ca2+:H+ antiporter